MEMCLSTLLLKVHFIRERKNNYCKPFPELSNESREGINILLNSCNRELHCSGMRLSRAVSSKVIGWVQTGTEHESINKW